MNAHREPAPAIEDPVRVPSGSETVLLVDDEPLVGDMAGTFLGEQGYRVLMARDGVEATRLALERPRDGIDLLLTDVVMPRMSGKELAETARERHPDETLASYGVSGGQATFFRSPSH